MRELTSSDIWQAVYVLLGGLSILFGVATTDLFFFFFAFLYAIVYGVHAWTGMQSMKTGFFFDRKKKEIQDAIDMKKLELVLTELREIRKALQKKR